MNQAVIGLGFGDEGKGLTTSWLAQQSKDAMIVRYSGGQQAGHTVVSRHKNLRHIFSNFGSGTFEGNPTYWSDFCTVCPTGILNELKMLKSKGLKPKLFIHGDAPVTTPYDAQKNRELNTLTKHGTCGVGVGQTFQREENFHHLSFADLYYEEILEEKLRLIAEYYGQEFIQSNAFLGRCKELIKSENVELVYNKPHTTDYIFESSQGLLLDQHFGFFPHVTRSNVGTKNINDIVGYQGIDEIYLVTRAYQTRHGNGFMTNEEKDDFVIKQDPYETNVKNAYQGEFRRSMLDVTLLEYGINKDQGIRENLHKTSLVITCLDHIDKYKFTYRGTVYEFENEMEFVFGIKQILNIPQVYISKSADSKNMKKV